MYKAEALNKTHDLYVLLGNGHVSSKDKRIILKCNYIFINFTFYYT